MLHPLALVLTCWLGSWWHSDHKVVAGSWAGEGISGISSSLPNFVCVLFQEDEFFDSGRQRGRHCLVFI